MKRIIAILMAAILMLCAFALAQDDATAENEAGNSKLPAPEEVAELESAEAAEGEAAEPTDAPEETAAPEETGEAAETDPVTESDLTAEAEPTEAPWQVLVTDNPDDIEVPEEMIYPDDDSNAPAKTNQVWFEEGFSLFLPDGWVSYAVSEEDKANGIRYALGDGTGERNLYIQVTPTTLTSMEALAGAVENTEGLSKTGDLNFGDADFVAFIDSRQNASCCATLFNGQQMLFMFTPQTDSDFMLVASRMMESFTAA